MHETLGAFRDELVWLYDHSLAATTRQFKPPLDSLCLARRIGEVDDLEWRRDQEPWIVTANRRQRLHVPNVILIGVELSLGGEKMERGKFKIVQRVDWPAVLTIRIDELEHGHAPVLETTEYLIDIR